VIEVACAPGCHCCGFVCLGGRLLALRSMFVRLFVTRRIVVNLAVGGEFAVCPDYRRGPWLIECRESVLTSECNRMGSLVFFSGVVRGDCLGSWF